VRKFHPIKLYLLLLFLCFLSGNSLAQSATGFKVVGIAVGKVGQPTTIGIQPVGGTTGQQYSLAITSDDGTGTASTPVIVPNGTTTAQTVNFTYTSAHSGVVKLIAMPTPSLGTPPTAEFITPKQGHPRIWITDARLARWRDYANRNTSRYQTLKTTADAVLNSGLAASSYFYSDLVPLAAMYQITGNSAYADRAIAIMTTSSDCAVSSNHLSRDSYFDVRDHLPAITLTRDWCDARMSTANKQQVDTWLMNRADETWADTNPSRSGDFGMFDASSNYWVGFWMTLPAAEVVYGDGFDTVTTGTTSSPDRAAYHTWLGRISKYRSYARPYFLDWGAGGTYIGAEGTNYDSTQRTALILDGESTAVGDDLLNLDGTSWANDSLLFKIYTTTPDLNKRWTFGTQANSSLGTMNFYDRQRMLFIGATTANTTYAGYAKYWLNTISPSTSGSGEAGAWEFLYWNEDSPATNYSLLPLSYFAPGPGILMKRSDWTSNASMWSIRAGRLRNNHQTRDENGFLLWRGGYLLGSAQSWSQGGALEDTVFQNNWTIGEQQYNGQFPDNSNGYASVQAHDVGTDYAFFSGNASGPYDYSFGAGQLSAYNREWAAMGSDTVIFVHDYLISVNAANHKRLILQSPHAFTLSVPGWTTDNGSYRVDGRVLLPSDVVLGASSWNYGAGGALSSYYMNIRPGFARAVDTMLLVMQTATVGAVANPTPVLVMSSDGKLEGGAAGTYLALFGVGGAAVDAVQPGHSYTFTAGPTKHLISNLAPSTNYAVVSSPSGNVQNIASSSSGVLRFDVPSGTTGVSLSTGGASGFILTGPSGGAANAQSQDFTLTINGPANSNYSFTLSSNGGGGTFTAAPSWSTNEVGSKTFRWTPANAGTWTVMATPSPGLGIPPTVQYTVTAPAQAMRRGRGPR
jgi:hypothetical protein